MFSYNTLEDWRKKHVPHASYTIGESPDLEDCGCPHVHLFYKKDGQLLETSFFACNHYAMINEFNKTIEQTFANPVTLSAIYDLSLLERWRQAAPGRNYRVLTELDRSVIIQIWSPDGDVEAWFNSTMTPVQITDKIVETIKRLS